MTEHFKNLEYALQQYEKSQVPVDFEHGEMFCLELGEDKKTWSFGPKPLPFTSFQFGNLIITDEILLSKLKKVPKCKAVLEADISILGSSVNDKKYDRPANPAVCMVADADVGVVLKYDLTEPEDDAMVMLVEEIIGFILQYGAPKEIRVSNILIEASLEQLCEVCKIKLRRVKRLNALDDFIRGMKQFM